MHRAKRMEHALSSCLNHDNQPCGFRSRRLTQKDWVGTCMLALIALLWTQWTCVTYATGIRWHRGAQKKCGHPHRHS